MARRPKKSRSTSSDKPIITRSVNAKGQAKLTVGGPQKNMHPALEQPWWMEEAEDAVGNITSCLMYWSTTQQRQRLNAYHQQARLYGGLPIAGGYGASLSRYRTYRRATMGVFLNYNVTQACLDTLVSMVSDSRPQPYWLTEGGDFRLQRRAKNRTKFNAGIYYECRTHLKMVESLIKALLWGDAYIWVRDRDGRHEHTVVSPYQMWCDEIEGCQVDPDQRHIIEVMERSKAMLLYPEAADLIEDADLEDLGETHEAQTLSDMITIRHSWHLPARATKGNVKGTGDGRYIMSFTSGSAIDEEYDDAKFPFASFKYVERPMQKVWGQGLVEILEPLQLELQSLCYRVQQAMQIAGFYKIWLPMGSELPVDYLTEPDATGLVLEATAKPEWITPPIVQQEVYAQIDRIFARGFDISGIPQSAAESEKPQGELSGEALRLVNDMSTKRFSKLISDWEQFSLDISDLNMRVLRKMQARAKKENKKLSYRVAAPDKARLDVIDWTDIALDEPDDIFFLKVQAVSSLPQDVAGKTQSVQELVQAGFIDQDTGRELLNFSDLDRYEGLANSERYFVADQLDRIICDGEALLPEPLQTPKLALALAVQQYWAARTQGVSEERCELLRQYIRAAFKMTQPALPLPPTGGAPLAQPAAPPVSNLLPSSPQPAQ